MKNKLIVLMGILAIMLVFGLVFIGCKQPANDEEGKQVVIKIENITSFTTTGHIMAFAAMPENLNDLTNTAAGSNTITEGDRPS